jgi:hypothetical protein
MKTHFLFPNSFKKIGWLLFVPSFILGTYLLLSGFDFDNSFVVKTFAIVNDRLFNQSKYFNFIENGILDELITVLVIVGGILVGFSKTKNEDEYISKIRYESLVWATYLNYGLILFFTAFVFGMPYLNVLFYNMFTLILFFIIRFHYKIYQLNKATHDDE